MLLAALQKGAIGQGDVRIGVKEVLLGLHELGGEGEKILQAVPLGQVAQPVGARGEEAAGGQAQPGEIPATGVRAG